MEKSNILFSIVVPFYDTIDYVKETIESIISQDHFNLEQVEVIVVNDGSKYNIEALINEYKTVLKNISYHVKENGNWGSVINYVKDNKLAHGEYVTILDSDDKLASHALLLVKKYLPKQPDIITGKFYRWSSLTNKKKGILVHWLFTNRFYANKKFKRKQHLLHTAYSFPLAKFYRTELFYQTDIRLQEKISFQDSVLFHKMASVSKSWQYINNYLAYYRDDRPSSSSNTQWNENRINAWIRTINNLDAIGASCNAYMYTVYSPFRNVLKTIDVKNIKEPITLHSAFSGAYIWKIFNPIAKAIFKKTAKKMAESVPFKFV